MSDRPEFSTRRLRAIAGGAPVEREEMAELVRLARLGQQLEAAPEVTVTSLGMGAGHGEACHAWRVDAGMDAPGIAPLPGQRVRLVIDDTTRGFEAARGIGAVRLMPGSRAMRDWQ